MERRPGHSALRWDAEQKKLVPHDPNPPQLRQVSCNEFTLELALQKLCTASRLMMESLPIYSEGSAPASRRANLDAALAFADEVLSRGDAHGR